MRGQRRRASRHALLVASTLVASVSGCGAVAPNPSASVPVRPSVDAMAPQFADVRAFRGRFERTGQMPGPGPEGPPVELWRYDSAAGYEAQPLIAGGLVIAISLEGEIAALDGATGAPRREILQLPDGVSSTPAISGDMLFVVTHDGELRAISLADWNEVWHQPGYDPSAAPAIAGDLVLAGTADGVLVARRIPDGSEAWSEQAASATRVSVAGGRAAMSGTSSDRVKVIELDDRTTIIDESTGGAEAGTPAQVDGNVYVMHRDVAGGSNGVDAFDATGKRVWPWEEPDGLRLVGIAVDDHNVYALTETPARVHAIDRTTGHEAWPAKNVGGVLLGDGGVADDLLYVVGTTNGLSAIDTSTGQVIWSVPLEVTVKPCRLVVSGGLVIASTIVDGRGRIVAFAGPSDPRVQDGSAPSPAAGQRSESAEPSPDSFPGVRPINEHKVDEAADLIGGSVGPDGTLYVPDVANHRILVLDPSGNQRWWGEFGAGEGQFDFSAVTQDDAPANVAVSPDGELIAVGEGGNHRVQLFDRNLEHIQFIGRTGRGDGQFINPYATIDAGHRLWVVDGARADVQVFDEAGAFLRTFPREGSGDDQLSRPGSAFVREDADEVLVPDFGNRRVAVFAKDGSWLRAYVDNPKQRFYLGEVNMVMTDPDDRVLILDTTNRIFFLDAAGSLLETLSLIEAFGPLDASGLALSPTGRLFVVDRERGRILEAQLEPPFWPAD